MAQRKLVGQVKVRASPSSPLPGSQVAAWACTESKTRWCEARWLSCRCRAQACGEPWAAGLGNREVKQARDAIAAKGEVKAKDKTGVKRKAAA